MRLRCLLAAALSAIFLFAAPALPARAQEDAVPPSYAPLIDGAVAEFGAGRWAEARALFRSAHEVFPNARTLRGIGMSSYELRDYPAAVRALAAALEEPRRALTEEQRAQVSELLARARAFVGRFVVPPAPEGSHLYLDGTGVELQGWPAREGELLVGVGEHEVTIRAPGDRSTRARLVVRGREDGPLDIDTSPLSPPSSPPEPEPARAESAPLAPATRVDVSPEPQRASDPVPWIVAGVGGAAIVTGAILLGVGLHDVSVVENAARGTEWRELEDAYDRAPALTGAGGVLLGVGVAAAVGGIVWGALSGGGEDERVSVRVGPGSVAIGGTF